jgi:hypothetical protein
MRTFVAVILAIIFAGCTSAPIFKVASDTCFQSRDLLRYNNLWLELHPNGTYSAELQGDIAMWGTAQGSWTESGNNILFEPASKTGTEFLRRARRAGNGRLIPAPISEVYDYKWAPLEPAACRSNNRSSSRRQGVS